MVDENESVSSPQLAAVADAIDEAEAVGAGPACKGPQTGTQPSIIPLGHVGTRYYFMSAAGERLEFNARDMVRLNIASMFGGEVDWLCLNFPSYNKKGNPIDGAFNAGHAAEWLMRQCDRAGLFNPEMPMRRHGVWRAGEHVVAHMGDQIWHRGALQRAGCQIKDAIYPACTKVELPDFDKPADRFDAQRLRLNMNAWNFSETNHADLLLGYIGASLLGGFPSWRVHAIVTGEGGSGKSTLARYIRAILGPQSTGMNDYTPAGIMQSLTGQGRVTVLEEAENDGDEQARRMAKIVSLSRKMSDGQGAQIMRGTSGGVALSTTVTGCFLIIAINAPPLQSQDRSRILVVPISKPNAGCSSADIAAFQKEAAALSPHIRARALIGAQRFGATFELYRQILRKHGCDDRRADFFSTLFAGRSLLLDDEMPASDVASAYVAQYSNQLSLIMIEDSDTSEGQGCLNHLMDSQCPSIRDGVRRSIGQIISASFAPNAQAENEKLIPLGLRLMDKKNGQHGDRLLFVCNDHAGLNAIFHNKAWANGGWRTSLMRLGGVRPSPVPVNVGGKRRGLLVPKELLPAYDQNEEIDCGDTDDPAPL